MPSRIARRELPVTPAKPEVLAPVAGTEAVLPEPTMEDVQTADLLIEDDRGRFLLLEVNSMPSWSGLQSIVDIDISEAVVRAFLKAVYAAHRPAMVAVS